jgi:uncharacterized protein (DUF58 family)
MLRTFGALLRLLRRNQSLLFVVVAFGATLGLAAFSGYWLFYRAAYVIGGLAPVCFVWARANLRRLEVTVERASDRLQVGQRAEARIRLSSGTFYPKLLLEVEDLTDMPGASPRTVVSLPAHGQRNWKLSLPCTRRGVFSVGPIRVSTGDPFGLFRFNRTYGASHPLLVFPLPEPLPHFWAPPAQLPGEGTVRRRTHYVTPNASAVRDYQPGDSFNRIHWPSTARLDRLMVKTFEMDPTSDIFLLLDLDAAAQAGEGDDSTEEYGVRIAASLAGHFLEANRLLGLLAPGGENVALEPARGPQHYHRILEALALVRADGTTPLARVLQNEERRFGRHSTLVVITPSVDEEWVSAMQALVQRGARAAVALLDPSSFGSAENALLPFSTLVASDILTYLVRRGDDLSLALGPLGTAAQPSLERQKAAPDGRRAGAR